MMNPYKKCSVKPQKYKWLRFGEIKPAGWLRVQMQRDMENGFQGLLDEIVPDLISKDQIYGSDRISLSSRKKELGVISRETEWDAQFMWWNSETQSNWRDGFVRNAFLLNNTELIEKSKVYIDQILSTQDTDGYLGIYSSDLRYNFDGENGELWSQASLFRVLLGYYEATGENRVLEAVIRAVKTTMQAFQPGKSHPFQVKNDYAGVCHGLVFTDILDRLYQLTNQEKYLDYALWLYAEYSISKLINDDICYKHLVDPNYRFKSHGVHTYEHLRSLLTAAYASGNPMLAQALTGYLGKLDNCLVPSGAPIGDEMIGGRFADAAETGYEYCSIHELLDSYSHLLQKTGDIYWGDRIEWLLFNAGQGARHPEKSAIAYLKTDNSYSMTGAFHPDDVEDTMNPQTRYKYSPAHQDVAVCCAPNAGRIYPYYIKSMWLRTNNGLLSALYGPCEVTTEINGALVRIIEQTNYPFDLNVSFSVNVSHPVHFELAFRIPEWSDQYLIQKLRNWQEEGGIIRVSKIWQSQENFNLSFITDIKTNEFHSNEVFFSYGPLVFALPLNSHLTLGKHYPKEGFQDMYYSPENLNSDLPNLPDDKLMLEKLMFNEENPWQSSIALTRPSSSLRLLPMGGTILRQTTFRKYK